MTAFNLDVTPLESAADYMRQSAADEGVDL